MDPNNNRFGGDVGAIVSYNKKNRSGLVVLVVLVVAIIVTIVVFLIFGGSQQKRGDNALGIFNKHANYLLFGSEDESDVQQVDSGLDTIYAFDCDGKEVKECREFFAKSKELLESFSNNYNYAEELDVVHVNDIDFYIQTFEGYYVYNVVGLLDSDEILQYYVDHGYESAKEHINDFYSDYLGDSSEDLKSYGDYQVAVAMVELDMISESDANGCLEGYNYNQDCVSGFVVSDELFNRMSSLIDDHYMNKFMENKRRDLIDGAVYISRLLSYKHGGNNEK